MGSKRGLSSATDLIDVAMVIKAFEEMNNVVLSGRMRVENVGGVAQLVLLWEAHDREREIGEVPVLASQRCVCGHGNHLTMESAIMWSLYQLDAQMARNELERSKPK